MCLVLLQKVVEADRLKAADLRAQHEKHIMEMSRITRASKQDVHKMVRRHTINSIKLLKCTDKNLLPKQFHNEPINENIYL